jgi:amino acid transporter
MSSDQEPASSHGSNEPSQPRPAGESSAAESAGSGSSAHPVPSTEDASPSHAAAEIPFDNIEAPPEALATYLEGQCGVVSSVPAPDSTEEATLPKRVKTFLVGKPRDLADSSVFQHVSLIAFLAWVGLGADGLSSSSYGPSEAFKYLGDHSYLAVFLSLATVLTVFIISACYSHIIEAFPSGGGGYLVASKLLGRPAGVVSGCALLVDYVLTITVSIAAAGDALFGLLSQDWAKFKLPAEASAIVFLIVLNLRGIKESVQVLMPVFILFLVTHALLIVGAIGLNLSSAGEVTDHITSQVSENLQPNGLGLWGMLGLLIYAYSFGAGTYTGIEAVSNSMPVMREPRVATAKRTMLYMALSLSVTAGGLMLVYLLLKIEPQANVAGEIEKTMNLKAVEKLVSEISSNSGGWGMAFILATILSEGALLIAAAQAGFIDGPRVLANMAYDSWMPHWLGHLSERLATQNGIMLMGLSALAALMYAHGNTETLVVMYSINVFLTFSLSMIGMWRHWYELRGKDPLWRRRLALFTLGAVLCLSILGITIYEKFKVGGWVTLAVTALLISICVAIKYYYLGVVARLRRLDDTLGKLHASGTPNLADPDCNQPTAAILVGGYSGLGVHTLLNSIQFGFGTYKNVVFLSAGVIDSGNFKGAGAVEELKHHTEASLAQYVELAQRLGLPSTSFMAIGTDAVEELEKICLVIKKRFPKVVFFAGQLVFIRDSWYQRLLHNQTAYALQRRLQWDNIPMVILPTRVR